MIPREPLDALQGRVGVVPVRTQLARAVAECHSLYSRRSGLVCLHPAVGLALFVRDAEGRYALYSSMGADGQRLFALTHNGVAVGDEPVELSAGDRLTIAGEEWILSTS